jgi:hypothetical protein
MSNTSERRSRRKFTDEFKADAVVLGGQSNGLFAEVAKELGSTIRCSQPRIPRRLDDNKVGRVEKERWPGSIATVDENHIVGRSESGSENRGVDGHGWRRSGAPLTPFLSWPIAVGLVGVPS